MAFTNSQTTALIEATKAGGRIDNAKVAFAKRVNALRETGFKPEWLDTKSERIGEVRETVAQQCLSPKERAIWADTSLARKVKKGDKLVATPRETYIKRVDKRIADLRNALREAPKTGAKQVGSARKLADRIKDEIAKLKNATIKDRDGEPTLACDHKELIAAFDRITDLVVDH